MRYFAEMNLKPELVEALKRINFIKATDVQEQVIPVALEGKDVIVRAKTGTGKTCAFLIPIMQNSTHGKDPEAIVIVPTRELALQIADFAARLKQRRDYVAVVYGGASINVQIQNLKRGPAIIIGTPGRIIDLIERDALKLNGIRFLVLDEADTMLDMGFIEDIEYILSQTPDSKQTLLFSATMPESIINVATRHMHDFSFMKIGNENELVVNTIKHNYSVVDNRMKFATLLAYINVYPPKKAIIFVQTKYAANAVHHALKERGTHSILMHGGLSQARREESMRAFKRGGQFLIATNVVARGIDVFGISDIINFDIPEDPRVYVHRVGRSARMEADGRAFSIVSTEQRNIIKDIEYMANIKMERIALNAEKYAHIRIFGRRNSFGGNGRHANFARKWNGGQGGYGARGGYEGHRHRGGYTGMRMSFRKRPQVS